VRNKENKLIMNQLKSGVSADVIARTNQVPISRVLAIERTLKSKK
jgi:hypothetical protein